MRFLCRSISALIVALAGLACFGPGNAGAQEFPSRVIRLVVAFPAGGPTDFVARLLADRLKVLLG
jgi:tripartite-type tricarboxylate transporter receptor subunit TctC